MEEDLKRALRRKPAPDGFAQRVQGRVAESRTSAGGAFRMRLAMAAALAVVTVSGTWTWQEVERRRGEEAKEKTLAALRLTSEKIQIARHRLQKVHMGVNQ